MTKKQKRKMGWTKQKLHNGAKTFRQSNSIFFIFFITLNAISQKLFWTRSNFLDWTITSWKLVKRQNSVVKRSFRSGPKLFGPNQIISVLVQFYFGLGRRSQWRFQFHFFWGFPIKRCKLCKEVVVKIKFMMLISCIHNESTKSLNCAFLASWILFYHHFFTQFAS